MVPVRNPKPGEKMAKAKHLEGNKEDFVIQSGIHKCNEPFLNGLQKAAYGQPTENYSKELLFR